MKKFCFVICFVLFQSAAAFAAGEFKIGAGRAVITPQESMWLGGYAARKAPSEGKEHDLFAKALFIEDETGARSVMVTTDLLGIPPEVAHRTAAIAQEKFSVPRERLMMTASHTHSGPVLDGPLSYMYAMDEAEEKKVHAYTDALPAMLIDAVGNAMSNLEPCRILWGNGTAKFAMNRRQYGLGGVGGGINPIGPVDHDVPVLKIIKADGTVKAVVFGYACHNTTLSYQKFCGDYAGFAEAYIEENVPGATALFAAGCAGDANPHPRGTVELARRHGTALGVGVLDVLDDSMQEVLGPLQASYREIPLPLSPPPSREELDKQLTDANAYIQKRAARLIKTHDEKGSLPATYPYPIQCWQFARGPRMIALAGEVVVDYSLRLKYELGGREEVFMIAYANDLCAYVPSLRVLREGGYEGGGAMIYYGLHGPWAPEVEELIIATVHELLKRQ